MMPLGIWRDTLLPVDPIIVEKIRNEWFSSLGDVKNTYRFQGRSLSRTNDDARRGAVIRFTSRLMGPQHLRVPSRMAELQGVQQT